MNKSTTTLKWLLFAGAIYFLAISIVHMLEIKVPLLFVYYNVPSYGYQDRIISFLSFGWSVFLFTASLDPVKNRALVKAILIAGLAAILGLNVINSVTDFHALSPDINSLVFRIETLGLTVYVAALIFSYYLSKRPNGNR
jgi:hypothetical protein